MFLYMRRLQITIAPCTYHLWFSFVSLVLLTKVESLLPTQPFFCHNSWVPPNPLPTCEDKRSLLRFILTYTYPFLPLDCIIWQDYFLVFHPVVKKLGLPTMGFYLYLFEVWSHLVWYGTLSLQTPQVYNFIKLIPVDKLVPAKYTSGPGCSKVG